MKLTSIHDPLAAVWPRRPAGIRHATMYTISGVLVTPALVGVATGRLPVMYGDQPLTGAPVELFGLVMLLTVPAPAAVLTYGLLRERAWARPGLLAWWIVLCAAIAALGWWLPPYAGVGGAIGLLFYAPAFWWYLYRKRSVVEYYASLERTV